MIYKFQLCANSFREVLVRIKMSSKEEEPVYGYIHCVSNVKLSSRGQTRYFNACLQEKEDFKQVVIFSPEKHADFCNAEKNRTPVKLSNVRKVASRQNSAKQDLQFHSGSQLNVTKKLEFMFDSSYVGTKAAFMTLKEVERVSPYQRVNTVAKVLLHKHTEDQKVPSGKLLKKAVFVIGDSSGTMPLTVWGTNNIDCVDCGKTYSFTDLSVRSFLMVKCVTTTPDTIITAAASDIQCIPDVPQNDQLTNVSGQIITAQVTTKAFCICKSPLDDFNRAAFSVKCNNCHMRIKTSSIRETTKALVVIESQVGKIHKLSINEQILRKLLPHHDFADSDTTEEQLLSLGLISFRVSNFTVQSIIDQQTAATDQSCQQETLSCPDSPTGSLIPADCFFTQNP